MEKEEEKSGVQKLRERHERIKKSLRPSKELIEALIRTGKMRPKEDQDKKVAKPYTSEAGT
jgi:hypothetical protein